MKLLRAKMRFLTIAWISCIVMLVVTTAIGGGGMVAYPGDHASCDGNMSCDITNLSCHTTDISCNDITGCGDTIGCNSDKGWEWDVSGWVETGIYANTGGYPDNGGMHTASQRRTDFVMGQLYLITQLNRTYRGGLRLGGQADLVYGAAASSMQCKDGRFDSGWAENEHGYALSMYQLYGKIGYGKIDLKVGKFITPIGWEESAAKNNFFYSHSYCYWLEPATHSGAIADFAVCDNFTVSAGWTTGNDNSLNTPHGDSAFLGGFQWDVTNKFSLYYKMTVGNSYDDGGDTNFLRDEFYIQSLCFEWKPVEKFTWMTQYNLRNDNEKYADGTRFSTSGYGINNHFLYDICDKWGVGVRAEWARDNFGDGVYYYFDGAGAPTNMYELTFGVNWRPCDRLSIRPEIRFDWADVPMYGERTDGVGTSRTQTSGGVGILYTF